MQTQLSHTLFDCILFRQLAHFKSHQISLSPKGQGSIGENYAAISPVIKQQPSIFEIHVIVHRYSTHCDDNITYGYVFTNLKALGHYSTHPSNVDMY